VGPKAALAILSSNSPEGLAMAIVSENEKALTAAPGIGKKIAQRIILELKDKLAKGQLTVAGGGETFAGGITVIPENKTSEASAALAVLGYSQQEIGAALQGIDLENLTLEEIIKQALKKMVK
jgi:Holliday junction DNA helicase RuvA